MNKNYRNFAKECEEAVKKGKISIRDKILLEKIAKAISEEDEKIEMTLEPFTSINSHEIKCECLFVNKWQEKIKNAVKSAYIYHQNVWLGYQDCRIVVASDNISKKGQKIVNKHLEKKLNERMAEKIKPSCHFHELVDYIVQLAENNKYEKCDGVIEYFIRNYDTSSLITEEELLNDLQTVIDGTTHTEEENIYSDKVSAIAKKYNTNVINIKPLLMVKIRCFDPKYLFKSGFFDLNTEDHEIIERKLKGEPLDGIKPFKMLSEIEL